MVRYGRHWSWVIFAVMLVMVSAGVGRAAEVIESGDATVLGRCGRGMLLEMAGQKVLLLAGSPYEMGYQHGVLMKENVRANTEKILFAANGIITAKAEEFYDKGLTLENAWKRSKGFIDSRYLEEMQGLADGAGLAIEKVRLTNIFPELFHCSGFALFGKTTKGGRLLHGRILDYMTEVGLQEHAVVIAAKPTGRQAIVTVGYAGFVGAVTGMNDAQVAIGQMGGGGQGDWDGMPMAFMFRQALEDEKSMDGVVSFFGKTARTCEHYYVISDGKLPDARALACTPTVFDVVKPGESYSRLPVPVEDAVLVSGGKRYHELVTRVQKDYGKIGVAEALDLMNRPVAMTSCLHRVLMAPQEGELWVANAGCDMREAQAAACYQPYYYYSATALWGMIPATTPEGVKAVPAMKVDADGGSEKKSVETAETAKRFTQSVGTVGIETFRALPEATSETQERYLQAYKVKPEAFDYELEFVREIGVYEVYDVRFPSAERTEHEELNTVYGEYFAAKGGGTRPAVIVLDILDGNMMVSRMVAHSLASNGIDACVMIMPYYGARKPGGQGHRALTGDYEILIDAVQQAVKDVRRTARLLASMDGVDREQIGLCGTSLGGMISALTAGVDGQFPRAAFVIASGDLATMVMEETKEMGAIHKKLKQLHMSREDIEVLFLPIEPMLFADRVKKTKVLMINAEHDELMPVPCVEALAQATGAELHWFDATHVGMVRHLIPSITLVTKHFAGLPTQ